MFRFRPDVFHRAPELDSEPFLWLFTGARLVSPEDEERVRVGPNGF